MSHDGVFEAVSEHYLRLNLGLVRDAGLKADLEARDRLLRNAQGARVEATSARRRTAGRFARIRTAFLKLFGKAGGPRPRPRSQHWTSAPST